MKRAMVGNAFLPTAFTGKWWANDKAVCPPCTTVDDGGCDEYGLY